MYIVTEKYSRYAEHTTGTQLDAVLDPETRSYIGVAYVPDDAPNADVVRAAFNKLAGFSIWTDEDHRERMSRKPEPTPVPDQAKTGDPLTDQAAHVYYPEELAGMKMPELKQVGEKFGVKVVPGQTKELVIAAILDAQSVGKTAGPSAADAALLAGPPPPSSDKE